MKFRAILPFKAGQVNKNGNLYPEDVIRNAIKKFNDRAENEDIFGGITTRDKLEWKDPTHKVLGAIVSDDNRIVFECETLSSKEGIDMERILTEQNIEYLPIMRLPKDQPKMINGIKTFTEITKIEGVSIGIKEEKR